MKRIIINFLATIPFPTTIVILIIIFILIGILFYRTNEKKVEEYTELVRN